MFALHSAPQDDSRSDRCRTCGRPALPLVKELMAMAAEPHRYDHDEVHGASLLEQQRLAGALVSAPAKPDGLAVSNCLNNNGRRSKPTRCVMLAIRTLGKTPLWKRMKPRR